MLTAYNRFTWTLSLSLGLQPLGDSFHSPLRTIPNLNYEILNQITLQLQPTLDMQGIVKNSDLNGLLFSLIVIA
jgi:hypothetical protein